jgi:hypothetical protein
VTSFEPQNARAEHVAETEATLAAGVNNACTYNRRSSRIIRLRLGSGNKNMVNLSTEELTAGLGVAGDPEISRRLAMACASPGLVGRCPTGRWNIPEELSRLG